MPEHLKVIMSLRLEDAFDFDDISIYILKGKNGKFTLAGQEIESPEILESKIEKIKDLIQPELDSLKNKISKIIDLVN